MPDEEGLALFTAGRAAAGTGLGPLVEIGSYCGKSTLYLAAAARPAGTVVFSVDHHRGSEENQAGWEHHDPSVVMPATGRIDTLPCLRATLERAGAEDVVVAVVGESSVVARHWGAPLAMVFIDGGHGSEPAWSDYRCWAPHLAVGGFLAIHDVFPDPADGGRPPYELWSAALASGGFDELPDVSRGSLRVAVRISPAM
ncbi:MAG: class I SAM-dependent methyltransferase [Acidimicrobiales bacterium]